MSESLIFISKNGDETEPNKKEAFRYMGYKSSEKNDVIEELYSDCLAELKKAASYKAVYREVPISLEAGSVDFGFCKIENANLYKNLSGCSSAVIFAATLGAGADRLIMRYSKISPAEGMICDCIASSAIEVWCDEVNEKAVGEKTAKPRFSPGYGGVSLTYQKDILAFLDAERKLGITLNDSMMMSPKKSVTAFIGIKG
ncbi:MAG: Vitamin B12 dependent methionine synthase activation subunit [Clostridia bacterium]|nr:Vitamin B12 dependent methionine synthase activation subunit [Clostridia bacterium]